MRRYNFGGEKGDTRNRSQYVRFSHNGEIDPVLKIAMYIREAELKGKEYDSAKKKFYYILNERGLFEEVTKGQPQGIEVKISYDAQQRRAVPKEVKIKGKKYTIEELLVSQVNYCQQRLNQGESGPNIGFVYTQDLREYMSYQDYIKNKQEEKALGEKRIKIEQRKKNLKREFNFGEKMRDPDKI